MILWRGLFTGKCLSMSLRNSLHQDLSYQMSVSKSTLYIKIRRLEHPQRKRQTCLYSKAIPNMGWRIRQRSVQEVKIILLPVRMQLYTEMSHLPVRKKLYLVKNDQELTVSSRYRVSVPSSDRYQRPYILTRLSALDHFLLNIASFVQEEELFLHIAAFVQEEELFLTSCTVACQILQLRFVI